MVDEKFSFLSLSSLSLTDLGFKTDMNSQRSAYRSKLSSLEHLFVHATLIISALAIVLCTLSFNISEPRTIKRVQRSIGSIGLNIN